MPFHDLPGVTTCRFKPREYLIRCGDAMPYVYYLKKGVVEREVLTPHGTEMVNVMKEGGQIVDSIVGLLEIFGKNFDGYCNDCFIAMTNCICYRIPVEVCKEYFRANPRLLEEALAMAIEAFDQTEAMLTNRKDLQAPQMICEFLLVHAESMVAGRVVPKNFTNVEIAKHLNVHSVTVSRVIGVLRKQGVAERVAEGLRLCDEGVIRDYVTGTRKMKYD